MVSESRVTWATSVPILVFLGLSVLELGPMYAIDVRQTDVRSDVRKTQDVTRPRLIPHYGSRGIIIEFIQRHTVVTSDTLAAGRITVQ